MVLMCVWSIELNWLAKYGKMEQKHNFYAFSGDMYRYTLNMYRYMLSSGHFGQHVPVQVRGVPVHVMPCFLFRQVFVF